MKNQKAKIAVYSKASALMDTLTAKRDAQSASSSMSLDYSIRRSSTDIEGLDSADAIIYDLSMVNNDVDRAAVDILHLKVKCGNKPLILIGSRQALEEALASPRIKPEVAHTISKPMSGSQLRLVSEAAIIKHGLSHLPSKSGLPMSARVGLGVAAVVTLAFAVSLIWMPSNTFEVSENDAMVESLIKSSPKTFPGSSSQVEDNASIRALTKLATLAELQGRLAFPQNDNALSYYDQILEVDGYHQAAYQGRQATLKALDGSLAILMSDGNFVEAEKLLQVLMNAEPFNDQYRRIDLALRNQKYAPYQASVNEAAGLNDIAKAPKGYKKGR